MSTDYWIKYQPYTNLFDFASSKKNKEKMLECILDVDL